MNTPITKLPSLSIPPIAGDTDDILQTLQVGNKKATPIPINDGWAYTIDGTLFVSETLDEVVEQLVKAAEKGSK